MCGIIGYIGDGNVTDILLDGLQKLEYRGYDSAGLAFFENGVPRIVKSKGRVTELAALVPTTSEGTSHCGIGHTRWATHGAPDTVNAHPHRVGRVTLVHNGIIENYRELALRYHPHPQSQTDSEIAAAVINAHYHGDAPAALKAAAKEWEGSYAVAVLFDDQPDRIYALHQASPLIAAIGKGGTFLASDLPALFGHAEEYYLPEEGETVILEPKRIRFLNAAGREISKQALCVEGGEESVQKNGYPHFMLKEIHEQPDVLRRTLHLYKNSFDLFANDPVPLPAHGLIHIVACGSAYHAGLLGRHYVEQWARRTVCVHIASEFRYNDPLITSEDLVIAISQSGETADTLAALKLAQEKGAQTLAIVNVQGSSLARMAHRTLLTPAGPEIAVATTKAYLAQVTLLQLLALSWARPRLPREDYERALTALELLPAALEQILSQTDQIRQAALFLQRAEHVFFIGRGQDTPLAMEGSLKLKEISYIHSESYAAGELKHGTISLLTPATPIVALLTDRARLSKTLSNLKEVAARGAPILTVGSAEAECVGYSHLVLPTTDVSTAPLAAAAVLQLLAYYVASAKGCDIDRPRNLAKSVTVE